MNDNEAGTAGKVVYLREADARAVRTRRRGRVADALRRALGAVVVVVAMALVALWRVARLVLCTLLVMIEPLLRVTLVPLAFLSFVVTLLFWFLIGDPRFPKWGMLAFSIGALWLYWVFLALMRVLMRRSRHGD